MKYNNRSIMFDTEKFVQVNHGYLIPPRPTNYPKSLDSVKECVRSAIYMASQIDLVEHGLSNIRPESVRPAYFRASLIELCRIDDIAKDFGIPSFFVKSSDPSLHIVKLLRNYQVHIASTELSSGQIVVQFSGEPMVYSSFIVENLSSSQLQKLDSSKSYTDYQLGEFVKLFDSQQRRFGVVQLLYHLIKHVEEYSILNLKKIVK